MFKKLLFILLSMLLLNTGLSISTCDANAPMPRTPQEGIQACDEMIKRNPQNAKAYESRAFFKHMLGDCDGVIKDANKALKLMPNSPGAYFVRGLAYAVLGDKDGFGPSESKTKAINDFTKAMELGGPNAGAYRWRGAVRKTARDFDNGIADLTIAINMDPNDAEAYFQRGMCYFLKKDTDSARPDFKKAVELDPGNEEYQKYYSLF